MEKERKYDLEDRLIAFAIIVADLSEKMYDTTFGKYISGQVMRSATSPALNYGEAKSAESINDFIHKMKISLKELRETMVSLKIIRQKPLVKSQDMVEPVITECNELISIFVKSIQTAALRKAN